MRVLFISVSCSKEKYTKVFAMRNKKLIDPQQKFCKLLIDGMSSDKAVKMECLSALPVSASTIFQEHFSEEIEILSDNLRYRYLSFTNGKIMRYLTLFRNSWKAVDEWCKENEKEQKVIVCDVLPYFITRPAQIVAKMYGVKTVGIITDLPMLSTSMKNKKASLLKKLCMNILERFTDKSISRYDAYISLTESIDRYVNNAARKPSLIIEGSVDFNEINAGECSNKKRIMLYAGGIYEKYGLKNLVEAFMKAETNGYELHVYGEGAYVNELQQVSEHCSKVKYMGMATLDEIVKREKEAMILVNPRPSDEEFSMYSFPSKTLEYMASGTPLLTTKLTGIPEEYFKYAYTFDKEDVDSMAEKIAEVTRISTNELISKGENAKIFVLKKKNNIIQGKKIIEFIKGIL